MRATVLLLLSSATALAGTWTSRGEANLALHQAALTSPGNADVRVDARRILAPNGVRRTAGQQPFMRTAVVELDEDFTVRCAWGHHHHLMVRAVEDGFVTVQVAEVDAQGPPNVGAGAWRTASVLVDGLPAAPFPGTLVLDPNGTFRWGQTRGGWVLMEDSVYLLGARTDWGPAELGLDGRTLRFSFSRGPVQWRVTLVREGAAPPVELLSAR